MRCLILFVILVITLITSTKADTIIVPAGGDLQVALNTANCGDMVELEAGATFTGTILLAKPCGTNYITIRSSRLVELPEGKRVTPADSVKMPKIVSPGSGNPALQTGISASSYRLQGIEFSPKDAQTFAYSLVWLGSVERDQDTLDKMARNLIVDRCYFHAWPNQSLKRGIDLHSGATEITNSYFEGFKAVGQEAQAILGCRGSGPYRIINNYLEGAGENLMLGACDPYIQGMVPSDIEIRNNYFFKPLSWRGVWQVKNLFELKNARRVIVDGNVFENAWSDAQAGYAIVLTPRNQEGSAPWSTVEDVMFTNNIVRHAASAFMILGHDNIFPSQVVKRITIRNNLFEDINSSWGPGLANKGFLISQNPEDVVIDRNTLLGNAPALYFNADTSLGLAKRLVVTKNAFENGTIASEVGNGSVALATFAPDATVTGNYLAQVLRPDLYPAGNVYPAILPATLPADVGYSGTIPVPVPSPIPTPIPSPSPMPSPSPVPTPTPVPTPAPACAITAPADVAVSRNRSTVVNITISGMTVPLVVEALGSSGQVRVMPLSKPVTGTSAIIPFSIFVKQQSRVITFQSPCGSVAVRVNVV